MTSPIIQADPAPGRMINIDHEPQGGGCDSVGVIIIDAGGRLVIDPARADPAMAGPQRPVKVETVAGSVYARLRRGILDGWIEPGARLRQVTLAQQLGVSRTPLREALIRLAAEGLVDLEPNHGARVVDGMGDGGARAAWELRLVLEPGIARLAAQRRARPGIDQLRAAVSGTGDGRSFHLALAAVTGNARIMHLARRHLGACHGPHPAHRAIARAVEEAATATAERLMRDHILALGASTRAAAGIQPRAR